MGKVLITTEAFRERKVAEEIENLLAMRGIEVSTKIFERFPGVLLVESRHLDSVRLSRVMINTAHIRRIVKKVIPVLRDYMLESPSYVDVTVLILEDFLPRVDLCALRGKTFCVRCRFRGVRGETYCEKLLGYYVKRVVPEARVSLEEPEYVLLVELVGEWCGVYFGPNDRSVLLYPDVQRARSRQV